MYFIFQIFLPVSGYLAARVWLEIPTQLMQICFLYNHPGAVISTCSITRASPDSGHPDIVVLKDPSQLLVELILSFEGRPPLPREAKMQSCFP